MFLVINLMLMGKLPWKPPVIEGCSLSYRGEHKVLFAFLCLCLFLYANTLEGKSLAKQAASREGVWSLGEGRGASVWHTYLLNIECINAPVIPVNKQSTNVYKTQL